jgi:hypothetical protein
VTGRSTSSYRRPLHTKRKSCFQALFGARGRQRVPFMHLVLIALHLTLQARYPHCSGCHFELKQVGFTAAYRACQCLLASKNTFILIIRAGLLQPHVSESGTWHNRDLIRRHACVDASPCESESSCRCLHVARRPHFFTYPRFQNTKY